MNSPAANALFTPSWHAELELAYACSDNATRPVLRRHQGPLRVQKHLYAEGPQVCQHIIVHPRAALPAATAWPSASGWIAAPGPS